MLILKWRYSSGNEYEMTSDDSAKLGQLYRLKVLENDVVYVELKKDEFVCISWTKPDGDE